MDFFLKNPAPLGFSIYGSQTSCKINLTNQWTLTIFEKKKQKQENKKRRKEKEKRRKKKKKRRKRRRKKRKEKKKRRKEKQANFIGHPATSEKNKTDRLTD